MKSNGRIEKYMDFDRNVRRNIFTMLILFAVIVMVSFGVFKVYMHYNDKLVKERDRIAYLNEILINEYIDYLSQINELAIKILCREEMDKSYYKTYLSLKSGSYSDMNWKLSRNREKYNLDRAWNFDNPSRYFHEDSLIEILGILNEDSIRAEQIEYIAEVYKVNKSIIEVYESNIELTYTKEGRNNEIYRELFYEGRMSYDLTNRMYEVADSRSFSLNLKNVSDEYYQEKFDYKLTRQPIEYAIDLDEVIDGRESTWEAIIEDNRINFVDADDSRRHMTLMSDGGSIAYVNESYGKGDLSEDEIDNIAIRITESLNMDNLELVDKKYEDYFTSMTGEKIEFNGYEYQFYVIEEEYYDLRSFVKLCILTDGTVQKVTIGNVKLLNGSYIRVRPEIDKNDAKLVLHPIIIDSIGSHELIVGHNGIVHEYEFVLYGINLYVGIDTKTGEIKYFKDVSRNHLANRKIE